MAGCSPIDSSSRRSPVDEILRQSPVFFRQGPLSPRTSEQLEDGTFPQSPVSHQSSEDGTLIRSSGQHLEDGTLRRKSPRSLEKLEDGTHCRSPKQLERTYSELKSPRSPRSPRRRRFCRMHQIVLITFFVIILNLTMFQFREMTEIFNKSFPSQSTDQNTLISMMSNTFGKSIEAKDQSNTESNSNAFSSCLLIKDDNYKLPEWLAYHYTAVPLKFLIIAVDPLSSTSPRRILEFWNTTTDMEILLWDDEDFMPTGDNLKKEMETIAVSGVIAKAELSKTEAEKIENIKKHRVRQRHFISSCLHHHQNNGRKWTMLIDTDEYLMFNKIDKNRTEFVLNYTSPIQKVEAHLREKEEWLTKIQKKRLDLPNVGNERIADFIEKNKLKLPWVAEHCMPLPRLFFGSVESPDTEVQKGVPKKIDASYFNTLRFRKHALKGTWEHNLYDKSIVDLSRVRDHILDTVFDAHRPLKPCQRIRTPVFDSVHSRITRIDQTLLRVHHYLGTWESYNSRNDTRRTRKRYDELANVDFGSDDDIRPWVGKFVEKVGSQSAELLLDTLE